MMFMKLGIINHRDRRLVYSHLLLIDVIYGFAIAVIVEIYLD